MSNKQNYEKMATTVFRKVRELNVTNTSLKSGATELDFEKFRNMNKDTRLSIGTLLNVLEEDVNKFSFKTFAGFESKETVYTLLYIFLWGALYLEPNVKNVDGRYRDTRVFSEYLLKEKDFCNRFSNSKSWLRNEKMLRKCFVEGDSILFGCTLCRIHKTLYQSIVRGLLETAATMKFKPNCNKYYLEMESAIQEYYEKSGNGFAYI